MSLHPQLERLVRTWAKDIHTSGYEIVFEAPLSIPDIAVSSVVEKLANQSNLWFLFYSAKCGDAKIIPMTDAEKEITSAFINHRMISLIDPKTGGGMTLDVSDEGGGAPTLQIAGWGVCVQLAAELGETFTDISWINNPFIDNKK